MFVDYDGLSIFFYWLIKGYQQPVVSGKIEIAQELYGNGNPSKPGLADTKSGSQPAERPLERPKLNLKPRSQPVEQSDGSLERERFVGFVFSF